MLALRRTDLQAALVVRQVDPIDFRHLLESDFQVKTNLLPRHFEMQMHPSCQCWNFPTDRQFRLEPVIAASRPTHCWYQVRCLMRPSAVQILVQHLAVLHLQERLVAVAASQARRA